MPQPDETRDEALRRLGDELHTFEAKRAQPAGKSDQETGDAYRLLGSIIGGVLGGLGLGWLIDHFAHTSPWALIGGLLIGSGLSIFTAVREATRMSKEAAAKSGPVHSVPFDDDDDD